MSTELRCIRGCARYPLDATRYSCERCGDLLEVVYPAEVTRARTPEAWKQRFSRRRAGRPGPDGSGVWRYREWVLPELPVSSIVTLGEGATPLTYVPGLAQKLGVELFVKQSGHSLSGSFKDLGMTVLVSQVADMRRRGLPIRAVACASTGDTSAALAAYGAAAGLRTLVLLPRGKISAAQLVQPLMHGARVLAIDTDFDGCMRHVQKLVEDEGVYLANSKNSLRIEGQKTVAFEIAEGLGWDVPEWVALPGGNLGNVSALVKGFVMLRDAGLTHRLPRILCAQSAQADPLYRAYRAGWAPLEGQEARPTHASAIRIGHPVSFAKAVAALQATDGVVDAVGEDELVATALEAGREGLYPCPQTAVALAAVQRQRRAGLIQTGERVAVVATAHGLKFTEFARQATLGEIPGAAGGNRPIEVDDDAAAVKRAALADV